MVLLLTRKLEKRPASLQIAGSGTDLFVGTYQLHKHLDVNSVENESSYDGALYLINIEDLDVKASINFNAGIFRFTLDENGNPVLALTDGRIVIIKYFNDELSSTFQLKVCSQMLLDCSILENKILCTNTFGQMFLIDSFDCSIISTFNVHKSSYCLDECEVWCCKWLDKQTCATGAEDGILKIWDLRCSSGYLFMFFVYFEFSSVPQMVGNVFNHSAGVTSLYKPIDEYQIMSGSYDDHFRLFDWRNFSKPLSTLKVNGGIWEINYIVDNYFILACMYEGLCIVHKQANSTLRLVKAWKSNNPSDLCYGAKAIPFIENELDEEMNLEVFSCFFNDYSVRKESIKLRRDYL